DLALDDIGRSARVRDGDEHDRAVDVRKLVGVQPPESGEAEDDQRDHRDDGDDRPLDGKVRYEHGAALRAPQRFVSLQVIRLDSSACSALPRPPPATATIGGSSSVGTADGVPSL